MDKASKVLRRSGVMIKSITGGHSDLQMVISQLKECVNFTFRGVCFGLIFQKIIFVVKIPENTIYIIIIFLKKLSLKLRLFF